MSKKVPYPANRMGLRIARDILANLHLYNFQMGTYVQETYCELVDDAPEASVKDQIGIVRETCHVCALGGMLLSFIGFYNKVDVIDLFHSYQRKRIDYNKAMKLIKNRLSEAFSRSQMILIEQAFEGRVEGSTFGNVKKNERAIKFFDRTSYFFKDHEVIKAIMENIVKNRGFFVP